MGTAKKKINKKITKIGANFLRMKSLSKQINSCTANNNSEQNQQGSNAF